MLEPVGPLPPSVYWRRRAVATTVVVLVLASLIWAVSVAASADGSEDVAAPAPSAAAPPAPVASRGALDVPPGGAGPLAAVGGAPGGPVPTLSTPTVPGGATPPLLGAGSAGARSGLPSAVPSASAAPAPPAVEPCQDAALRVVGRTDKESYAADERPLFSLVVTNTGAAPCTRDLGPARTAMAVVVTPGDGLWGSDDCAPGGDPDVRTLAPGQEQVFSVRWAGRTSVPGCPAGREAVGPGTYQLLTRLDGMVSEPARFAITS